MQSLDFSFFTIAGQFVFAEMLSEFSVKHQKGNYETPLHSNSLLQN